MVSSGQVPIVLDACVLVPPSLCDLLLRLAETPALYRPVWTQEILDEVTRNQPGATNLPQALIDTWQGAVKGAFPEAMVDQYDHCLSLCQNDEKDRHVLAVAIATGTHTILTFNRKHFPDSAICDHGITATHPAEYLATLYDHNAGSVVKRLEERAARAGRTLEELLQVHAKTVPGFVDHVREKLGIEPPQ
ncbi:PIN domain-containing protein [bacterium]|nr:MAG: PIN domain-containing protein [bacterium]